MWETNFWDSDMWATDFWVGAGVVASSNSNIEIAYQRRKKHRARALFALLLLIVGL